MVLAQHTHFILTPADLIAKKVKQGKKCLCFILKTENCWTLWRTFPLENSDSKRFQCTIYCTIRYQYLWHFLRL